MCASQDARVTFEENVPLAPFTTFKIGGPARYFFRAKAIGDMQAALTEAHHKKLPWFILGAGSNILVHDRGFAGVVIKMEIVNCTVAGTQLIAGAGTAINGAIRTAVAASLGGLEFATGVPASIGGAVWANLGCRGSDISHVLGHVQCCTDDGSITTLTNSQCQFSYRDSIFKHKPWIVLEATFSLQKVEEKKLRQRMLELTHRKREEQEVGAETAGCAFRNPEGSQKTAAQLIDELDLKGYSIGGAKVSEKHANFIVNTGGATADHIVQLISYIKQQVRDRLGIQLTEEIEYVGFE